MEHDGCRNCKYEHLTEHEEPCNRCKQNATDLYEPMTNADRIRQMQDEELADFLCKVKSDYQWVEHEYPSEEEHGEWLEWIQKGSGE